ncbi:hypothetical protein Y032_0046g1397 [Ancylostoma ceylanicum]|nr:hypothetical protein Y032_0046g1397 [Ancylostoma ceylanicum]
MLPVLISHLLLSLFGSPFVIALQFECQGQDAIFNNDERGTLLEKHNELRKEIAEGKYGTLPPAKNMYELQYNCKMEKLVDDALAECSGRASLSEQYGQNFFMIDTQLINNKANQIKAALAYWAAPLTFYGLNNVSNYDDNRLYTFANMAHAKTLQFGCGHQDNCDGNVHISCIYNLIGGYPGSVIYEKGRACKKNTDCTTYERSTCLNQLCVFKGTPPVPGGGENTMCRNNKGMTDPGRKAVLDAHNKRRSQLAKGEVRNGKNPNNKNLPTASFMPRMVYDCDVEAGAIEYASSCTLEQSKQSERKGYGENVYVYKNPNAVPADAFKAATKKWWDQIFLDGINWEVIFKQSLRDKKIDQKGFTQMAWANSIKLGCAVQTCGMKSFVVCRYSPAGNVLNQTIYAVGDVCSGCQAACKTSEGLCM